MKPIQRSAFPGRDAAVAEKPGIGLYGETSLHDALKRAYARPGDRFEVPVEGSIIDIVRSDGELVEVQTASLRALRRKLEKLCAGHRVRVVHPVIARKTIVRVDHATGQATRGRASPKKGDLWSAFDELVKASWIPATRNLSLELAFVRVRETWVNDGEGSWRRKGSRVRDRELEEIVETKVFSKRSDWTALIPKTAPRPWSSANLAEALGIRQDRARKILYVFAKAGFAAECGKDGNRKLYEPAKARRSTAKRDRAGP